MAFSAIPLIIGPILTVLTAMGEAEHGGTPTQGAPATRMNGSGEYTGLETVWVINSNAFNAQSPAGLPAIQENPAASRPALPGLCQVVRTQDYVTSALRPGIAKTITEELKTFSADETWGSYSW